MMKRFLTFLFGIQALAIGIILNTKSQLGVGSINTLPYALSEILGFSLGTMTTVLYIVFIVMEMILLKKIDVKILLQFPFSFVFGVLIDFYASFLNIIPQNMIQQFVILMIAIAVTALGVFMMVTSDYVLNPGDGIVHTLSQVLNQPFGKMKITFDVCMVIVTTILCLLTKGYLIGVGIGTVVSALLIGQFISFYQRIFLKNKSSEELLS